MPELARAGLAGVVLFGVCGLGVTRLLLPETLRRYEALWVLPIGACACALALTVLGFAYVPFDVSLPVVLAAFVALDVYAMRRRPTSTAAVRDGARRTGWPFWLALLLVAVALIPLFRAGFATVEGQGQDAHLAVGSAIFLQHAYPTGKDVSLPVDLMPLVWASKQPIYYALAANASLAGLEVHQTISTTAALLLGLAALGFFLVAVELLGAPVWAGLLVMGLVGLDRMVLHTVMHPYFNQTWGFMAMPFVFVLAWWAVRERRRGAYALLAMTGAICFFAYPLALPIPLIPLTFALWPHRRRLNPKRLYTSRRSLLWMVPAFFVLLIPIEGGLQKIDSAQEVVLNPTASLETWGGDLLGWFPEPHFFGMDSYALLAITAPGLLYAAWLALKDLPPPLRRGLLGVLAFGAWFTVWFRVRDGGWYFHFKTLAFVAPVAITLVVVGLAKLRDRRIAYVALALYVASAAGSASDEIGETFDQLPRHVLQLREVDASLPPGQSVRLDIDPQEQNWAAFMLHGQPLCSQRPLLNTDYPHVRTSRKADWLLTKKDAPKPRDAAPGGPARELDAFTLWRAKPDLPGPENCSQEMVQTVKQVTL